MCDSNHIYSRMSADLFEIVTYYTSREDILSFINTLDARLHRWNNIRFSMSYGVAIVPGTTTHYRICGDKAGIARTYIKNSVMKNVAFYNDIPKDIHNETAFIEDIEDAALTNHEFHVFLQPKYRYDKKHSEIVGAEALVRWIPDNQQIIPPDFFIPIFEKNGFILKLDQLMWESVCMLLWKWIGHGNKPIHISINVSRIDIFATDVPQYIFSLLEKYQIPEHFIKIEITESAYTENNNRISATVNTLRRRGLTVMMDDFGCGYSSLNMLKDIPVDVLKLDMRFLRFEEEERQKTANILEAIVNMAGLLHLPIVVEGVEDERQEKFVQNLGCRYTQGFYYYKPLPIHKFEELLRDKRCIDTQGLVYKQVEPMHIREFIDTNFVSDSMLNNVLGPVIFFEVQRGDIKLTRVNEQYFRMIGEEYFEKDIHNEFLERIPERERNRFCEILEKAFENPVLGADGILHLLRDGAEDLSVYIKVFYMQEKEGWRQNYCSLIDIAKIL